MQYLILEEVLGIIDAKIQYINFQTKQIVSTIIGSEPDQSPSIQDLNGFNFAHNSCDSFLNMMEEFSMTKKRLLILRNKLDAQNADFILNLLSDNIWNAYSEKQLTTLIKYAVIDREYATQRLQQTRKQQGSAMMN